MKIEELADLLGITLIVERFANQSNSWTACFKNTEIADCKSSSVMGTPFGRGKTPREAINNYIENIRGKWLVIDAMKDERREFGVPELENYKEV
jgi:hypothetical protein